jgi:hypothetical protein
MTNVKGQPGMVNGCAINAPFYFHDNVLKYYRTLNIISLPNLARSLFHTMSILNNEFLAQSFNQLIPSAHDSEKRFEPSSLKNNRHEQPCYHCEHGQTSSSGRHSCHNIRLRQLLSSAMAVLLVLGGLLSAWSCVNRYGCGPGSDNLMRRELSNLPVSTR